MAIWAAAYDLPHLADPGKKIASLPILDYRWGKHADVFREEGAIKIPVGYGRLDDVHFVDPDDHANDVGSVIHFFQRECLGSDSRPKVVGSFVTERRPDDMKSRATSVTDISGRGLTPFFLDRMKLLPFDYPTQPTVQSDWNFGVPDDGGLLVNPGFEGEPLLNGGFEEGTTASWQATDGSGIFGSAGLSAVNSTADARSGDWYGLVNPSGAMGGVTRSIPGFVVGEEYTIVGWLNDPSATGDRFRAGISGAISASHTNVYEEDGYFWADIGNAAEGAGASTGSYQSFTLTFIAADTSIELAIVYDDTGDPNFLLDDWSVIGQNVGVTGWNQYEYGSFSTLTKYEYDTAQAHTGNSSLNIAGSVKLHTDAFGRSAYAGIGTWQEATLTPGKYYTATVWVRHDGAGDEPFSLILARVTPKGALAETLTGAFAPGPGSYHMAASNVQVPANTWTRIQFTVIADTSQVQFQIRWRGDLGTTDIGTINSPANVWFDTASLFEGLPAVNMGEVWTLIQGAQIDWLVPTFTETLDSDGVAWDTERSFTMSEGDSWGQIAEGFQRLWGYVHRIRFDIETNIYYFDIFNPGYMAVDHSTTDTGSLIVGMNILEGETVSRAPDATSWHIKGEGGIWVEDEDATLQATWGEGQMFLNADSVGSAADLQAVLDQAKLTTADQMVTFQAGMNDQGQVIPNRDIDVFHNISVELGGQSSIPRGDRIVTSVVVSGKPGQAPNFQIYVNSDAFASTGAAALAEAVRRLLRRTQKTPEPVVPGTGGGDKGGQFTIQIAAADANEISKGKADRLCLGITDVDGTTILEAINEVATIGGEVHLSDGSFLSGDVKIIVPAGVTLTGRGRGTHIVSTVVDGWAVTGRQGAILRGFDATNPNGHGVRLAATC